MRRAPANSPARMKRTDHARLWRIVEGAAIDAMKAHPDYLTPKGRHAMAESVTKRVVGALISAAQKSPRG